MPRSVQIHFLTPYPASCLVRGADGRPKQVTYGGVPRGRISSAALKRAVRTQPDFAASIAAAGGEVGIRTAGVAGLVAASLVSDGAAQTDAERAAAIVANAFGKVGEDAEEGETRQLAFVSPSEVAAARAVAARILAGEMPPPGPEAEAAGKGKRGRAAGKTGNDDTKANPFAQHLRGLMASTTRAADIAMFGRMLAQKGDSGLESSRMTAACEVAHPFTVGRAMVETDFFVARDDLQSDAPAGFLSEQFFLAGVFYGYARIDLDQLERNLGGDGKLAQASIEAFIRGVLTATPAGKRAPFNANAHAAWAMVEVGRHAPRSLAAAFVAPVGGEDQLNDAARRAERIAEQMDRAYGSHWRRATMDVGAGGGTLDDLTRLVRDA
jgi:CRISPR system Cascade subunit CasC